MRAGYVVTRGNLCRVLTRRGFPFLLWRGALAPTDEMDDLYGVAIGKAGTGKGGGGNDIAVAFHNDSGGIIAARAQHGFDGQAVVQRDPLPIDDDIHGVASLYAARDASGKQKKRVPLRRWGHAVHERAHGGDAAARCQLPYVSTTCLRFRGQDAYALSQPVCVGSPSR